MSKRAINGQEHLAEKLTYVLGCLNRKILDANMKETIFHHFVTGLTFLLSFDVGNSEMYGCRNTTDLVRIEVNQNKMECVRDEIDPDAEFEGVVKAIGFTGSGFTESQSDPDSERLTWDSLTTGEVYNTHPNNCAGHEENCSNGSGVNVNSTHPAANFSKFNEADSSISFTDKAESESNLYFLDVQLIGRSVFFESNKLHFNGMAKHPAASNKLCYDDDDDGDEDNGDDDDDEDNDDNDDDGDDDAGRSSIPLVLPS
ncbi:hypothetical protein T265_04668 [Opisthorchis viverrini]|uniref:Uncharacterized protein n=1 Tax=Opisthorchis viverrini TaxID=6198 RepID=A0A075AG97_OPIVI|nr:hypothetical protein T265_04668 [Opisthorchis viverrini]KER28534.1 hypothetical protein T265_04668 [Opisthorchis viverrini]